MGRSRRTRGRKPCALNDRWTQFWSIRLRANPTPQALRSSFRDPEILSPAQAKDALYPPVVSSPLVKNSVLVPFDYSAASRKALAVARSLVDDVSQVRVLNVVQPLVAPPTIMVPTFDTGEIVGSSEKALAEVLQETDLTGAPADVEVGAPGPTIVEYARRSGVDLIVMPTHGRTGLERVFVGSVAEYVVRHAHCPVLALRGGD